MKRFLYAVLAGCILTFLPLMVMRLSSEAYIVKLLKWGSTTILLPGTFVGFIAAGSKIDDISFVFANLVNLILYSALTYVLLMLSAKPRRDTPIPRQ
jgi:hypothetical protein